MKQEELNKTARGIIRNNIYLTLATTDGEDPWASPLFYTVDKEYNFYYISQLNSLHSKNIAMNPSVSFAIFNTRQKEGEGNGVQARGVVKLIKDSQIKEAMKWYKTSFIEMNEENFMGDAPYRLFKITPSNIYILDPDEETDKRVEVFLSNKV